MSVARSSASTAARRAWKSAASPCSSVTQPSVLLMTKKPLARLRMESMAGVVGVHPVREDVALLDVERERWAWGTALEHRAVRPQRSGEAMMWVRRSTVSRRRRTAQRRRAGTARRGPSTTSPAPPTARHLAERFLCWISPTTLLSCGGWQSTSTMKTATTARENGVGSDQSPYHRRDRHHRVDEVEEVLERRRAAAVVVGQPMVASTVPFACAWRARPPESNWELALVEAEDRVGERAAPEAPLNMKKRRPEMQMMNDERLSAVFTSRLHPRWEEQAEQVAQPLWRRTSWTRWRKPSCIASSGARAAAPLIARLSSAHSRIAIGSAGARRSGRGAEVREWAAHRQREQRVLEGDAPEHRGLERVEPRRHLRGLPRVAVRRLPPRRRSPRRAHQVVVAVAVAVDEAVARLVDADEAGGALRHRHIDEVDDDEDEPRREAEEPRRSMALRRAHQPEQRADDRRRRLPAFDRPRTSLAPRATASARASACRAARSGSCCRSRCPR